MENESIKNLPEAEIELDRNLRIKDTYICVYNDGMNMIDINDFPIMNKFQLNKKVNDIETIFTNKLKENGLVGNIYSLRPNGVLVEGKLKLSDIADKLGSTVSATEVGVRYNMSVAHGLYTTTNGKRVIKRGNSYMLEGRDQEASQYEMGIAYMKSLRYDETETDKSAFDENNCFASKVYPWTHMRKVQISLDDNEFNYDMDVDNGGNYFTEVPLYYIKEQFLLEQEYSVTGYNGSSTIAYKSIFDMTSSWDNEDPLRGIPKNFSDMGNLSIGHYKWVSKYPLDGYRPASPFINKVKKVAVVDDGSYDNSIQRYIKICINGTEYYQKYKNYIESDIYSDEPPVIYVLVEDESNTEYAPVLERKHYFSCFRSSTNDKTLYDGKQILWSRPNTTPGNNITLPTFRTYVRNLNDNYYITDMRAWNDFFIFLMDIEFKTFDSQTKLNGISNISYNTRNKVYFDQTKEGYTFYTTKDDIGTSEDIILTSLFVGTSIGNNNAFGGTDSDKIPVITDIVSPMVEDEDFFIEKDSQDNPIIYYMYENGSFGTDASQAVDSTEIRYAVRVHNGNSENLTDPYYAIVNTTGEFPKDYLNSNELFKNYVYYYNNELYGTFSTESRASYKELSSRKLCKVKVNKPGIFRDTYIYACFIGNSGLTDKIDYRTGSLSIKTNNSVKRSIKWNWIENPYAGQYQFLDGCHVKHNMIESLSTVPHNALYVCDKTDLYSETFSNYNLISRFYGPTASNGCCRIGFDPENPWAFITTVVGNNGSINGVSYKNLGDSFYSNTGFNTSDKSERVIYVGGYWGSSIGAGCRFLYTNSGLTGLSSNIGSSFQRKEG